MSLSVKPSSKVQPPRKKANRITYQVTNAGFANPSEYLKELARKRSALTKITEEPTSPPLSSDDLQEQERRINLLRDRVQDAWIAADGNPADGKWIFLTHLLRMGVTSGRNGHWIGARTDFKIPEQLDGEGMGWLNAETEAEWNEWEKRVQEERRIKDKVESWKRRVDVQQESQEERVDSSADAGVDAIVPAVAPPSKTSDATNDTKVASESINSKKSHRIAGATVKAAPGTNSGAVKSLTTSVDPLKDTALFGFAVVKRSSQLSAVVGKPGSAAGKWKASKDAPAKDKSKEPPSVPPKDDEANPIAEKAKPTSTRNLNIRNIADIPELSFLPPSFPSSQMLTSTPKLIAKPPKPSKPASIPHVALPSSSSPLPTTSSSLPLITYSPKPKSSSMQAPPSSPRVIKTYGRHNQSQSPHTTSPSRPLEISASLPAIPIPTTPTRHTTHKPRSTRNHNADHDSINEGENVITNGNNKRLLDPPTTPTGGNDRALKKARTMPSTAAFGAPASPKARQVPPSPRTPTGADSDSGVIPGLMRVGTAAPAPMTPQPKKQPLPTLTELLASAKKGKKGLCLVSLKKDFKQEQEKPQDAARDDPIRDPVEDSLNSAPIDDEENPYMLDPYAISIPPLELSPDPYSDDVDVASPTKSLSSLAGSDSEDDEDAGEQEGQKSKFDLDFSFRPVATSTQQRGPFFGKGNIPDPNQKSGVESQAQGTDSWASVYAPQGTSGGGSGGKGAAGGHPQAPSSSNNPYGPYASYNSQFESAVAAQVDRVDKLLEKDVDYEGWLRDPEGEEGAAEEVESVQAGVGQNVLGYGSYNYGVEESP